MAKNSQTGLWQQEKEHQQGTMNSTNCAKSMKTDAIAVHHMRRALELAHKGLYTTGSNPRVGCLLVNADNQIVGEGWHKQDGDLHAEAMALSQAGTASRGTHAYVTLEPCCHQGKQPACSQALIDAGVCRVTIAAGDPNPQVAGDGIRQLQQAGIKVAQGLLAAESIALNPGFHQRMLIGMPWVRLKIAMSLDGKIAAADGSSQWITSEQARADTMHWRARAQAIVTGRGTVEHDSPQLTARGIQQPIDQPQPIILDSQLRLAPDIPLLCRSATLVSCKKADSNRYHPQLQHLQCSTNERSIDLPTLVKWLSQQGYNEVHLEAGAQLSGSFLEQQLVNELLVYQAPTLLGNKGLDAFVMSSERLSEQYRLQLIEQRRIGKDWRLRFICSDSKLI